MADAEPSRMALGTAQHHRNLGSWLSALVLKAPDRNLAFAALLSFWIVLYSLCFDRLGTLTTAAVYLSDLLSLVCCCGPPLALARQTAKVAPSPASGSQPKQPQPPVLRYLCRCCFSEVCHDATH